ncbi:MAG: branched-chain amino acid ABC transporter permease [Anaerolineae bacterium]|nr:branched-chain amino acid ABC transporter permease [Anaerolineae bacterium]
MRERLTDGTGTSVIGGTEAHFIRSLPALLLPIAAAGAALALVPLWLGDSRVLMGVAVLGLAFACYTIGFNVIFGSTGQLFLCVGALAGVGGYGAAILADTVGLPIVVSILVATLAATFTGGLLSFVAVRRSLGVIFTGIITLIFSLSFEALVLGLSDLTGGDTGRLIDSGADTFLRDRIPPYYLMLALMLVFLLVHGLLRRSHIGWAFRALRDDEVAAELAGVDVARYRVYAALIGAAMLGLAGSTYAFTEGRISPTTFGFGEVDVVVLVMLAFGGIGALFGPIVGAVTFTLVDEVLIEFGQLRHVAYGILIIVLFLRMPRGVIPTVASLWRRVRRLEGSDAAKTTDAPAGKLEAVSGESRSAE